MKNKIHFSIITHFIT